MNTQDSPHDRSASDAPPPSPSAAPGGERFPWAKVVLIAFAGLLLRAVAARGDLWLDEIWTLDLVRDIASPVELLTRLRHDNNHPLNSLLCWLLLKSRHDFVFRLPSVLSGGLAVVAAARIAWRLAENHVRSLAALVAAGCFAVSFLMVNYGSEARGYGLALAFSLLAWACTLEGTHSRQSLWMPSYWLATLAALLAHPSSVHLVFGLVCLAACTAIFAGASRRDAVRDLVAWHAIPILACAAYYLFFLRLIIVGGGTPTEVSPFIAQTVASITGIPELAGGVVHAAVLVALVGWLLVREWKRSASRLVLFATALIVSPLVVHSLTTNRLLYPRYFLIPAAALLIGVAIHATEFCRSAQARRVVVGLAVLLFAGNAYHLVELIRFGRGSYRDAIVWMAERSSFDVVVVASDNNFRNGTVLAHHARRLGLGDKVQLIRTESAPVVRPEWILLHRFHPVEEPAESFPIAEEVNYVVCRSFRGGRLSGWTWYIYRNAALPKIPGSAGKR